MGLKAELNVLREKEQAQLDRQRDMTHIEQELIQEMQVIKSDSHHSEIQAQSIANERRAIKAESLVESLQMELQMLKLDSSANKKELNQKNKSLIEFIQQIQEDVETILKEKASNSNLLSEFVSKTLDHYRSQ